MQGQGRQSGIFSHIQILHVKLKANVIFCDKLPDPLAGMPSLPPGRPGVPSQSFLSCRRRSCRTIHLAYCCLRLPLPTTRTILTTTSWLGLGTLLCDEATKLTNSASSAQRFFLLDEAPLTDRGRSTAAASGIPTGSIYLSYRGLGCRPLRTLPAKSVIAPTLISNSFDTIPSMASARLSIAFKS